MDTLHKIRDISAEWVYAPSEIWKYGDKPNGPYFRFFMRSNHEEVRKLGAPDAYFKPAIRIHACDDRELKSLTYGLPIVEAESIDTAIRLLYEYINKRIY